MSQSVKEFVRQSGVQVQKSNSNSNDEFARELEENMLRRERERAAGFRTPPRRVPRPVQFPVRLQQNLISETNYRGAFRQFENEFSDVNEEQIANNILREFDQNTVPLQFSKFNPGMFNVLVDSGFGPKDAVIDLKKILVKSPLPKTPIGEGLYLDTKEIRGVYGRFQTGFSHTKEFGPKGNMNRNFASVQIAITVSNDVESQGGICNIYKNGKVVIRNGFIGTNITNQPELIRRFIVNTYTERQSFFYNPFTYNNLSGQFRINGTFKSLSVIASRQRMYGMTNMSIVEELTPFLYVPIEGATLIFSKSGNIQIVGVKSPGDMLKGYDTAKELVEKMYKDTQVYVTGVFDKGTKSGAKPKAKPKAKSPPKPKRKYIMKVNAVLNLKKCARMKKPELIALARRKGVVNFRTKVVDGSRVATKDEICKKIMNINKPTSPPPRPKPKPPPKRAAVNAKRNVKKAAVITKRGLDENSIRKDIAKLYGDKWMNRYKPALNKDVRNMKSALNAITQGNKMGIPFKKNIDEMKKRVVGQWKMERKRELERKYLMNSVSVNGIAFNLKNDYRRAAANYIMNKKTAPSNTKMMEYRKYWLQFRANVNARPKGLNRMAKARVEKL